LTAKKQHTPGRNIPMRKKDLEKAEEEKQKTAPRDPKKGKNWTGGAKNEG